MLPFIDIDLEQLNQLVAGATVLHTKNQQPRIFQLPDNSIVKYFNGKNNLAKAQRRAQRFIRNSHYLREKQILTVTPSHAYRCVATNAIYLRYPMLPGQGLDHCLAQQDKRVLLQRSAVFLAKLHQQGVYFRDLHPGNLLYRPPGFALIDIQNINFHWFSLPLRRRAKNFATFCLNRSFPHLLDDDDLYWLLNCYCNICELSDETILKLHKLITRAMTKRKRKLNWDQVVELNELAPHLE